MKFWISEIIIHQRHYCYYYCRLCCYKERLFGCWTINNSMWKRQHQSAGVKKWLPHSWGKSSIRPWLTLFQFQPSSYILWLLFSVPCIIITIFFSKCDVNYFIAVQLLLGQTIFVLTCSLVKIQCSLNTTFTNWIIVLLAWLQIPLESLKI